MFPTNQVRRASWGLTGRSQSGAGADGLPPALDRRMTLKETPGKCLRETPLRVAVAVIVEAGRLLIAHRFRDALLPDLWEFPGGKIESGESPEACAVRETAEELDIRVEVLGLLLRRPYEYANRKVDLWFYVVRRVDGEPRALGCQEWAWVTLEEIDAYPFPDANAPVVDALRAGGWLL
jgi:mutator protein MutT